MHNVPCRHQLVDDHAAKAQAKLGYVANRCGMFFQTCSEASSLAFVSFATGSALKIMLDG